MGKRRECRKRRKGRPTWKDEARAIEKDPGLFGEYTAHWSHYNEKHCARYPFSWGLERLYGDRVVWINRGLVDIAYLRHGESFKSTGALRPAMAEAA